MGNVSLKVLEFFVQKWVRTLHSVLSKIQPIREPLVLEKVLKFAQQFSRSGKSLENGDEVWKNGKKTSFFLRQHVNEIFFVLVKSYSISSIHLQHVMKKALFLHFKVYVDHLFDNLKSGKRNYCFGKKSRKSLVIDPKICMNPGSCIQCVSNMFDMLKSIFVLLRSKVLLAGWPVPVPPIVGMSQNQGQVKTGFAWSGKQIRFDVSSHWRMGLVWLPCKQALLFCQPLVTFRKKISFYGGILLMLLHKGSQNSKLALSLSPGEDYTVATGQATGIPALHVCFLSVNLSYCMQITQEIYLWNMCKNTCKTKQENTN